MKPIRKRYHENELSNEELEDREYYDEIALDNYVDSTEGNNEN